MKPINWFQLGVVILTLVVWTTLSVDSWQMEQSEKVIPRESITPAMLDLARREYRARVEWCRLWVKEKEMMDLCKQDALIAYQEKVE